MPWDYIDEKKFKTLVKQITGSITEDDGELVPYHTIKGKGTIWCFQPSTKTMIRLLRGTKIYILDRGPDEEPQCLAYTDNGNIVILDKDETEEIGFN